MGQGLDFPSGKGYLTNGSQYFDVRAANTIITNAIKTQTNNFIMAAFSFASRRLRFCLYSSSVRLEYQFLPDVFFSAEVRFVSTFSAIPNLNLKNYTSTLPCKHSLSIFFPVNDKGSHCKGMTIYQFHKTKPDNILSICSQN
ncbi:MAG: hypothetical protein ACI3Z7_05505 [Candidatus Aphodosoma sp.]